MEHRWIWHAYWLIDTSRYCNNTCRYAPVCFCKSRAKVIISNWCMEQWWGIIQDDIAEREDQSAISNGWGEATTVPVDEIVAAINQSCSGLWWTSVCCWRQVLKLEITSSVQNKLALYGLYALSHPPHASDDWDMIVKYWAAVSPPNTPWVRLWNA